MDKKILNELKGKLEIEKKRIEEELGKFAKKDSTVPGDWDTRFPHWNGSSGSGALEEEADEVEEYGNLLPVEHSLEIKLRDIDLALDKMKKGTYGKCENCKGNIPIERLRALPEARICFDCEKKKKN